MSSKALPDPIVQEIRSLVAVLCRNHTMTGKTGDGETNLNQVLLMEKIFHGSEGYASHLELFFEGKGPFECAFTDSELENNMEGNQERASGKLLELRAVLHCDLSARYIVGQSGFNTSAIAICKANKLEGRNINDKALSVIATLKFAYRFHGEFVQGNGENPSGMKLEDMLLYVRQKCFVLFKGKKNMYLCKRAKNDKVFTEDEMPLKYFFTGYFAFVLFGPQGISGHSLECLTPDGEGVKKKSREQARKEDQMAKKSERDASVGGYVPGDYNRGIMIRDKVSCAHIAQAEVKEARQNVRELLFICNQDHQNILEEIKLLGKMIEVGTSNDVDTTELRDDMNELYGSLKLLRKRKKDLTEESDRLLMENQCGKRQIHALYEQVGTFEKVGRTIQSSIEIQGDDASSELSNSIMSPVAK